MSEVESTETQINALSDIPTISFDFSKALTASVPEIREMISAVEDAVRLAPQIEIGHVDRHSGTVYAREINPVSGTLIVGKIHKHATINFLLKGVVDVFSQDGLVRITAPATFVSTPGAKRVIYVVEDARWTCCHGTTETDVEKIEEEFIAKSYDDVLEPKAPVKELKGT